MTSLISVKRIKSETNQSFDPKQVEEKAKATLEYGGLVNPLVVHREDHQNYTIDPVSAFDLAVAQKARELEPLAGEMVNGWVIENEVEEKALLAQLDFEAPTINSEEKESIRLNYDSQTSEKLEIPKHKKTQALVSVKRIKSEVNQQFETEKIEKQARNLLEYGALVKPLVVRREDAMNFVVHPDSAFELAVAQRAREIDPEAAEMINAWVLENPTEEKAYLMQRSLTLEVKSQELATVTWDELISKMDYIMERIGWSKERGKEYLQHNYGVQSRLKLTDAQLLSFLEHLESQPTLAESNSDLDNYQKDLLTSNKPKPVTTKSQPPLNDNQVKLEQQIELIPNPSTEIPDSPIDNPTQTELTIYCSGISHQNKGGWGYSIYEGDKSLKENYGGQEKTTEKEMQQLAIINSILKAIELNPTANITVVTSQAFIDELKRDSSSNKELTQKINQVANGRQINIHDEQKDAYPQRMAEVTSLARKGLSLVQTNDNQNSQKNPHQSQEPPDINLTQKNDAKLDLEGIKEPPFIPLNEIPSNPEFDINYLMEQQERTEKVAPIALEILKLQGHSSTQSYTGENHDINYDGQYLTITDKQGGVKMKAKFMGIDSTTQQQQWLSCLPANSPGLTSDDLKTFTSDSLRESIIMAKIQQEQANTIVA